MAVRHLALIVQVLVLGAVACAPAAAPAALTAAPARPAAEKPAARAEAEPAQGSAAKPEAPAAGPPPALTESGAQRSSESSQTTPGGPELRLVQNLGRMIIYTTELTLLVRDLDAFPSQAANIATGNGGYVAGMETKDEGGVPTIVVRLKIPPERYEAAMRGLRGLGVEVRGEKATTQDVTEEYNDVQIQLASLEATHAQLLEIQKRAETVEEVLKVQQQAAQVKLQIDRLKGRATALERLSELATITARAQAAEVVLQRDYVSVRTALRKAETTRAMLETQLQRARTPEEEASLRDRLGEVALEIARHETRISDLEAKAVAAHVTLPTADAAGSGTQTDVSLPQQYVETRVALLRAEYEQAELTRALRAGRPDADPKELTRLILEVSRLNGQLTAIQERSSQMGISLPSLTPEQEAALAGVPSGFSGPGILASIRNAWEASLDFIQLIGTRLVTMLVFLWWALPPAALGGYLFRRRATTARARGETAAPS